MSQENVEIVRVRRSRHTARGLRPPSTRRDQRRSTARQRRAVRRRGSSLSHPWARRRLDTRVATAAGARIDPITIRAYFGSGSPHPHLQGGTVGDWPLNVFNEDEAAGELGTLRAIA